LAKTATTTIITGNKISGKRISTSGLSNLPAASSVNIETENYFTIIINRNIN